MCASRSLLLAGASGPVDRQFGEVRAAQAAELGVQVGEVAALEQRVVAEVDAGDDVGGVERHLLGLGEVVVRVAVQGHLADLADGQQVLGPDLGGVEDVEVELHLVLLGQRLDAQFPLEEVALL